jgi:AraC-like DNA-binding protein
LVKSRKILAAFLKENPNQHWDGEHYRVMQRWLKGIFLLYAVMSAMFVFNYTRQVILDVSYDGPFLFFIPWLRMSILVVFVLRILLFPEVLFGVPTFSRIKFQNDSGPVDEERAKLESKSKAISPAVHDPSILIEQSGNLELTNIQVADYLKRVFKYVQEFQPQTYEDFTLEKLCKQVNIPKSHFSYLLKYHFKETFVEYRTRLRIELACQLLKNSENRLLTLEAIGENVGFSSRFTFIRAFKKVKGITPSEFLAELNRP